MDYHTRSQTLIKKDEEEILALKIQELAVEAKEFQSSIKETRGICSDIKIMLQQICKKLGLDEGNERSVPSSTLDFSHDVPSSSPSFGFSLSSNSGSKDEAMHALPTEGNEFFTPLMLNKEIEEAAFSEVKIGDDFKDYNTQSIEHQFQVFEETEVSTPLKFNNKDNDDKKEVDSSTGVKVDSKTKQHETIDFISQCGNIIFFTSKHLPWLPDKLPGCELKQMNGEVNFVSRWISMNIIIFMIPSGSSFLKYGIMKKHKSREISPDSDFVHNLILHDASQRSIAPFSTIGYIEIMSHLKLERNLALFLKLSYSFESWINFQEIFLKMEWDYDSEIKEGDFEEGYSEVCHDEVDSQVELNWVTYGCQREYTIIEKFIILIWNWFYKDCEPFFKGERKKFIHPSQWIKEWRIAWIFEDKDLKEGELIRS